MDLKKLGKTVANFAPLLGSVIGGPAGGAIGEVVASAFGTNNTDELENIIKTDPKAAIKLREIESNNLIELQKLKVQEAANVLAADTSRINSVNKTMQSESRSDDNWQKHWRPFWGYISGTAFFLEIMSIIYAIVQMPSQAPEVIKALATMDVFWGVPLAILGISAYHRGKEKRAIAGEDIKPLINFGK